MAFQEPHQRFFFRNLFVSPSPRSNVVTPRVHYSFPGWATSQHHRPQQKLPAVVPPPLRQFWGSQWWLSSGASSRSSSSSTTSSPVQGVNEGRNVVTPQLLTEFNRSYSRVAGEGSAALRLVLVRHPYVWHPPSVSSVADLRPSAPGASSLETSLTTLPASDATTTMTATAGKQPSLWRAPWPVLRRSKSELGVWDAPVTRRAEYPPRQPTKFDVLWAVWVDSAALTIQRHWRGRLGRRRAQEIAAARAAYHRRVEAATAIQRAVRRWHGRWRLIFEELCLQIEQQRSIAAIRIQRNWRRWQRSIYADVLALAATLHRARQAAATVIQRCYRGYNERNRLDMESRRWVLEWRYDSPGRVVEVVGTFSRPQWTRRVLLTWSPSKRCYTVALPRIPGRHEFKFVVDGGYCCDGAYTVVSDGAGHYNNVTIISEAPDRSPFQRIRLRLAELQRMQRTSQAATGYKRIPRNTARRTSDSRPVSPKPMMSDDEDKGPTSSSDTFEDSSVVPEFYKVYEKQLLDQSEDSVQWRDPKIAAAKSQPLDDEKALRSPNEDFTDISTPLPTKAECPGQLSSSNSNELSSIVQPATMRTAAATEAAYSDTSGDSRRDSSFSSSGASWGHSEGLYGSPAIPPTSPEVSIDRRKHDCPPQPTAAVTNSTLPSRRAKCRASSRPPQSRSSSDLGPNLSETPVYCTRLNKHKKIQSGQQHHHPRPVQQPAAAQQQRRVPLRGSATTSTTKKQPQSQQQQQQQPFPMPHADARRPWHRKRRKPQPISSPHSPEQGITELQSNSPSSSSSLPTKPNKQASPKQRTQKHRGRRRTSKH